MVKPAILLVGGGILQEAQTRIAKDLGLYTVVTDRDPGCRCAGLADEFRELDIYDIPGHVRLAHELRARDGVELKGVFTSALDAAVTVAYAARAVRLPHVSAEAASWCKNKVLMRAAFELAGIPNPRWEEVLNEGHAEAAAISLGFPYVCKNVDNTASRGSSIVRSEGEVVPAFREARDASTTGTALFEELWEGPEQSVEIMFLERGAKPLQLNVVDRLFLNKDRFFIEEGHVSPSSLPRQEKWELFALAERAASAVGVDFGVFKIDTIWTRDGFRVLECTPRLSGGFDSSHTQFYATGRDFVRAAMRLALGEEVKADDEDLRHKCHCYAAARAGFPPPGKIVAVSGVEETLAMDGVRDVILRCKVGDVIRPYEDCAGRPVFVVAKAESWEGAWELAGRALEGIKIETLSGHFHSLTRELNWHSGEVCNWIKMKYLPAANLLQRWPRE